VLPAEQLCHPIKNIAQNGVDSKRARVAVLAISTADSKRT
jgi:hypothetical protein